jgi:hypothetical protein
MNDKNKKTSVIDDIVSMENNGNTSDLSKVVDTLLNSDFFRRKTRLHKSIIGKLSALDTISQIWDIQFLKEWIPSYTEYLTSESGKGRQEIVDITKYTIDKETQKHKDMIESMGRR